MQGGTAHNAKLAVSEAKPLYTGGWRMVSSPSLAVTLKNQLNRSLLQIKERRTEAQRSAQKPVPVRCSTRVLSGRQHAQSPCDYWQFEDAHGPGLRTDSRAGRRLYGTIFWEE